MLCYCTNFVVMHAVCAFAKFLDVTLERACSHSPDAAVMYSSKLYVEYAYISCSAVVIAFVQLDVLVLSIPIKATWSFILFTLHCFLQFPCMCTAMYSQ